MGQRKRGILWNIKRLIREGLSNQKVLEMIKRDFPHCRTRIEQVRAERQALRDAGEAVMGSVEARRSEKESTQWSE
jgi:hypothetical protein